MRVCMAQHLAPHKCHRKMHALFSTSTTDTVALACVQPAASKPHHFHNVAVQSSFHNFDSQAVLRLLPEDPMHRKPKTKIDTCKTLKMLAYSGEEFNTHLRQLPWPCARPMKQQHGNKCVMFRMCGYCSMSAQCDTRICLIPLEAFVAKPSAGLFCILNTSSTKVVRSLSWLDHVTASASHVAERSIDILIWSSSPV